MPANTRVSLHSRLPMCLLHVLIQVSKSPLSCLNQLPVLPFFLLHHSNKINMTQYTSFGCQPPFTGFYMSNSAAEYATFAYKLLTFTEDSYSLQQPSWMWWNRSAWPRNSVTALCTSFTIIHLRYRQNVLVIILAMRYLDICHHPFWPWKSWWDGCWPGNCIHRLDADGKQPPWAAHVV